MTKGPNSPEAKRHRGGRSPVTADEEMTERNQLSIPNIRGASGRGSGGNGDRNSAPRAAPARRITALSPEELTQGFLLHEEQLAMLQHQVSIVFKFPEDSSIARSLMKAVREWQAEHKAGTSHPWGSCSRYTAASLLKELTKFDDPPKNFCSADNKYFKKVVQELGTQDDGTQHEQAKAQGNGLLASGRSLLDLPPVRSSIDAMAAWTVLDPAKEARAVLDEMAKHMLDDPSMPAPAPLQSPPADVLRTLLAGNEAGQAIGKGNSSEVHACQSEPRYVIRTVRQQDEVEWQRELSRLRRVPALSVITTIFATSGRRSLMPRLWPVPRGALRTMEVIRLKSDPACFVLIDYSGCTGDSVYPLHLGYGASGYGGVTNRPPTLESPPDPIRTANSDYYRLARTILKQLHIGPEPSKRKHSDRETSLPSHLDKELRTWLERDTWPRPPGPTSPFPPGSWQDSAISPTVTLHASLWKSNGEVKSDTATFTSPASKFGNSNGTLVPEGVAGEGMQGTGSWERSAISAPKCQLKTCGRFARTIFQEIFPWQDAPSSGIPDKSAIVDQGAPPPGAQVPAQAVFSAPVQNAIRAAAANLSGAISFAQDMEQSMPSHTHQSLLRTTSDILWEVSEELLIAARNDASSTAPGSASEAADQPMAQALYEAKKKPSGVIKSHVPGGRSDFPSWWLDTCGIFGRTLLEPGPSPAKTSPTPSELDKQRQESVATALKLDASPHEAGIKLLLPPLMDITDNPFTLCPTENLATSCLHSKWAPLGVFSRLLDGLPSLQDSRHSSPSIEQPPNYKSIFFGAYSQGQAMGLHSDPHNHKDVPNVLIPLSVFTGGQLFVESDEGDVCLDVQNNIRGHIHPITLPFLAFDAHKRHSILPWSGCRLILGSFHVSGAERLPLGTRNILRSLGFSLYKDGQVILEEAAARWRKRDQFEFLSSQNADRPGSAAGCVAAFGRHSAPPALSVDGLKQATHLRSAASSSCNVLSVFTASRARRLGLPTGRCPAMSAAQTAAMPFLVLSDSTLQYLLWMDGSGKSYGVETVDRNRLHQAIICPGASLIMPRDGPVRTPPVLEVLAWHFIRVLGHEEPFPTDHAPLIALLKKYYYSDVYVRLIPLRQSLNPEKQGAYDWLADVRDQYGLAADDLSDQTIMSLQGNDPGL
ncbi:unnamed protein product, partial [Symbiodinium necroappetens]